MVLQPYEDPQPRRRGSAVFGRIALGVVSLVAFVVLLIWNVYLFDHGDSVLALVVLVGSVVAVTVCIRGLVTGRWG